MYFSNSSKYRFWFLNILFWLIFYTICMIASPPFLIYNIPDRIGLSVIFMIWILIITGGYRWIYQHYNFENLSYLATIFQIIISALILIGLDISLRFRVLNWLGVFAWFPVDLSLPIARAQMIGVKNFIPENASLFDDFTIYSRTTTYFVQAFKFLVFVIWIIGYNAYHYVQKMRQKDIEKLGTENRAKDLELINLRSQLNPHFLFNALNSIHSLAMMKKDNASDAVLLLSDLMRYTLNYEKRDVVPLADEIEVVEKYIDLEKIRFGKKLNAELSIAEDTLAIKIPPIIVQTLVENAIKHGLKDSPNGVLIKIQSQLEGDFLKIDIINSGQLQNSTPSVNQPKNSGIGVENTRRRLEMIYGEMSHFELKNRNETEVIASLLLPINS
jgi:hypothetical protein